MKIKNRSKKAGPGKRVKESGLCIAAPSPRLSCRDNGKKPLSWPRLWAHAAPEQQLENVKYDIFDIFVIFDIFDIFDIFVIFDIFDIFDI